jgi:hypothetical protein
LTSVQDFLLAIPIDGLCQHMFQLKYRTILMYHLIIPLFHKDKVFPIFRKACDALILLGSMQLIVGSFQVSNTGKICS